MAIDKIHFEVNAGPYQHPVSTRQLLDTLRRLSVVFGYFSSLCNLFKCLDRSNSPVDNLFLKEATEGVPSDLNSQQDIEMQVCHTCCTQRVTQNDVPLAQNMRSVSIHHIMTVQRVVDHMPVG